MSYSWSSPQIPESAACKPGKCCCGFGCNCGDNCHCADKCNCVDKCCPVIPKEPPCPDTCGCDSECVTFCQEHKKYHYLDKCKDKNQPKVEFKLVKQQFA
jgi:hypothetical protein